jgi:hypothetical protein
VATVTRDNRWCLVALMVLSCGGHDPAPPSGSGSAPVASDAAVERSDPFGDSEGRKLFHCAAASGDADLIVAANVKLGLGDARGTPNDKLAAYAQAQPAWTKQNARFASDFADPAKAAECARERLK